MQRPVAPFMPTRSSSRIKSESNTTTIASTRSTDVPTDAKPLPQQGRLRVGPVRRVGLGDLFRHLARHGGDNRGQLHIDLGNQHLNCGQTALRLLGARPGGSPNRPPSTMGSDGPRARSAANGRMVPAAASDMPNCLTLPALIKSLTAPRHFFDHWSRGRSCVRSTSAGVSSAKQCGYGPWPRSSTRIGNRSRSISSTTSSDGSRSA